MADTGYTSPLVVAEIENVSKSRGLFDYIQEARQAQGISPQAADSAWSTWNLLNRTLSDALAVPDASYGPTGQFLFLWDKDEHHLELEIEPDGNAYFFYRNRVSGGLWNADCKAGDAIPGKVVDSFLKNLL